MTIQIVAFAMPVITLVFVGALAYGIVRYNRRPAQGLHSGPYKVTGHLQDGIAHHP